LGLLLVGTEKAGYPFFTIRLTQQEKFTVLQNIHLCPTLLQQFIHKAFDLRVAVIGDQIFAVEIHSQQRIESQEDFRLVSPNLLKHQSHNLPASLHAKIRQFMDYYGLVYSSFDFAVTPEGDYYFLENNPNGQWLWLEFQTELKITDSFLQLMLRHMEARSD
jgi:glutathione synthase/RimK-type ligase-like ATP-grasp enzyme